MMVVLWRSGGGGHLHGRPLPLADEDARPVATGYVIYILECEASAVFSKDST
jgi:hypothetical protein